MGGHMSEDRVTCPTCGAEFALSDALTAGIETRLRATLEVEFAAATAAAERRAAAKAREDSDLKIQDLQEQVRENVEKLTTSRARELEFLKKQRELEEKESSAGLEFERRLREERSKIEELAVARIGEEHRLRDQEKDKQLGDLRKQIEDLKRKAEQGSQQMQGEAAELDFEGFLRSLFPQDDIAPVPTGIRGVDVVQRVIDPAGRVCGTIAWEVKNTKNWSDGWLAKLREDQRELKADVAVVVTRVLPPEVGRFGVLDGAWVSDHASIPGLATALRVALIQVARERAAAEGRGTKMECLYGYLTGTEFRQRVEAVVEAFVAMQQDLDRERRAAEASWAKREKQIGKAIANIAGMYGDMQGIVGSTLPTLPHLELEPVAVTDGTGGEDIPF